MTKKLLALLCYTILLTPSSLIAEEELYVLVKRAKVKAEPFYLSKDIASLKTGQKLTPLGEEEKGWIPVQVRSKPGYIAATSVTSDKSYFKDRESSDSVDSMNAVELAAKGLGKLRKIEQEYFAKEKKLNLNSVASLERIYTTTNELVAFQRQGKLGGAQ